MQYVSNTDLDRKEMLRTIGVKDFEALLRDVPEELRLKSMDIPAGLSEMELLRELRRAGQKNAHADRNISFLGAGNYDHYIPSIVNQLATRGEFITAYTPYQGEASQGTLQSIFEYQSLICLLTGMEVSNASMYDGASTMAEVALMVLRHTDKKEILVADGVHPESFETLITYVSNLNVEVKRIPLKSGTCDVAAFKGLVSDKTALVILQTPNFLGYLDDIAQMAQIAKQKGAVVAVSVNPLALSVLTPPGEEGADIVFGDGRPLGNPVSYGGPHFGFFAVKREWMRRLPGRICGETVDREGKRAFVLTLQAREQHIRREKATSNICTNHALCALKATIFLTTLGPKGFRRMGELNIEQSHIAFERLSRVKGITPLSKAPFFNEFTVRIDRDPDTLRKHLTEARIIGPLHLGRFRQSWHGQYLVAVTEQRTLDQIEHLVRSIEKCP
jgi:glycine dehydrogenase subunit 1